MDRRTFVATLGALAAGTLAGCLSGDPPAGGDGSRPTDDQTETPSPTPDVSLAETSFTVEDVQSGTGNDEASVSFDDGVAVDGTIMGKNGCYTASLGSATLEDATLEVVVDSHERDDADACTQALVDIDYRASFTFEGRLPDRVVVEHDIDSERTTVAEASP
jgi:hypothetical protein